MNLNILTIFYYVLEEKALLDHPYRPLTLLFKYPRGIHYSKTALYWSDIIVLYKSKEVIQVEKLGDPKLG